MMHSTPIGDVRAAAAAANAVGFEVDAEGHPWVSFRDGWGAARFLLELSRQDARRPWVQEIAAYVLREVGGDHERFARALQMWGQSLPFFHEVGEIFQGPALTIQRGGDCDCHARLIYALAAAGGLPAELAFLHRGDGPTHVLARALVGGTWKPLETTVAAHFGEDPIAAAKRLGVVRDDLNAPETITMGELTENVLRVAPQHLYRMRIRVNQSRDSFATIDVGLFLRLSFEAMGFQAVKVSLGGVGSSWPPEDRPPLRPDGTSWTAWIEGAWYESETALAREVGTGPLSFAIASADESALPSAPDSTPTVRESSPSHVPMGELARPIVHTRDLSDAFFADFRAMAGRLGANPIDMLAVLNYESGVRHAPPHGPDHRAYGINQIMDFHLTAQPNALGWPAGRPPWEFETLTEEEQLPFTERYFRPYAGHLHDVGAIYAVNFLPGRMQQRGSAPGTVLTSRGESYYESNQSLDYDQDGHITIEDLSHRAKASAHGARWDEMVSRLGGGTWSGGLPSRLGSVAAVAVLLVGGGVLAAIARELGALPA